MMTIGDFGSKSKLTVGSGANQVPEWSYIKLNKPMEEWLTQTPEQKLAQFYSEGTKVFRDGSTMAPGQQVATPAPQQPKVTLPDAYRQNATMAKPLSIPNGLTMPDYSPRVQPTSNFGQNWNDFLSIANARQQR